MLMQKHLKSWGGSFAALVCVSALSASSVSAQEKTASTAVTNSPVQLAANTSDTRSVGGENMSTPAPENKQGLETFYRLLDEAEAAASQIDRYSATLEKQVRIDGVLLDPEVAEIKVRHEPFSVYLKWPDKNREALFVSGQYDNKILARTTKGLAALKGVWELEPTAPKAMEGCRYPITEAGLKKMVERVNKFYREENTCQLMVCEHRAETRDGKPVILVQIQFPSADQAPYSTCEYLFDPESKLLFGVEICEWDHQGQPAGTAEKYIFSEINTEEAPADIEFDAENPDYSLLTRK